MSLGLSWLLGPSFIGSMMDEDIFSPDLLENARHKISLLGASLDHMSG